MPIQLPSSINRATSANTKAQDSPPSPTARPQLKFDDQNDNFHRVEFDAPLSSSPQPLSKGRFSIDLSIELERELAGMESPPDTPMNMGLRTGVVNKEMDGDGKTLQGNAFGDDIHIQSDQNEDSLSPDPEILSHIITQLRLSLASLTQERDTLVVLLAKKTEEEASVKDALEAMVERATNAEEELSGERKKVKEGEEQIGLLRGKVEESRRGLMRLQTENRRQSGIIAPIDVNRASALTFANAPLTSASSKRASFTPLTGSRHGRMSSVSDVHNLGVGGNGVLPSPIALGFPNGEASLSPNPPHLNGNGNGTHRVSGLFGRHSPSEHDGSIAGSDPTTLHPISSEVQQELDTLKAEVKLLKTELDAAKRDVVEANEAREASEMCAQALRGFIKENAVGIHAEAVVERGGVKLPSTPMMAAEIEDEKRTNGTSSGWGFTKLWGSSLGPGNSFTTTSTAESTITKPGSPSLPCATAPTAVSAPAAPLISRKLTGLFGSRSARGSNVQNSAGPAPPSMMEKRDSGSATSTTTSGSASTGSDVSSVIEPVSPALSGSGLGLGMGFGAGFGQGKIHEIAMNSHGSGVGIVEKGLETPATSLHEIELHGDGLM